MPIKTISEKFGNLTLRTDGLYNDKNECVFPKVNGVFKISESQGYTGNFGFQWTKFIETQIDREITGSKQSTERLLTVTEWDKEVLKNKTILEVGCGAGRFTKVVLAHTEAELHSVDYSIAAEACYKNNVGHNDRLFVYQASIYEMPFQDHSFDKVFCFGVLQHTPDVKRSVESLIQKLKPGGEIIIDFYPLNGWYTFIHAKYILRPFTKKMNHEKLLKLIDKNIDWMISLSTFFNRIGIGRIFNRFIPICDISIAIPANLPKEQIREWAILDTFDMFSPEYDSPQKVSDMVEYFQNNNVKVTFSGQKSFGANGKVVIVKGIKN